MSGRLSLAWLALGLAGVTLAAGYAGARLWLGAAACLGLAGLQALALRGLEMRRASGIAGRRIPTAAFCGFISLATAGMVLHLAPALMLLGACAALAAWDLDGFYRRAGRGEPGGQPEEAQAGKAAGESELVQQELFRMELFRMEQRHLGRLAIALLLGYALGLAALGARLQLSFGVLFALGLLAFFILNRLAHRLRAMDQ